MRIIENTTEFQIEGPSAVAIGKFDGIHLGHQKLLERVLEEKKKQHFLAVLFTFDPSPAVFFSGQQLPELTTREEKRTLFERMGIDVLIEYPLTATTAATPPEAFIQDILMKRLHAKVVVAGADLSFGAGGSGDSALLQRESGKLGYRVDLIDKVCFEGQEISSTRVREEVGKGHMEQVARMLGTPYTIAGEVQHGNRIGRTIGMPTVNLVPVSSKLLPPKGVYYSLVEFGDRTWQGITNIGSKPTVSDTGAMGVETYLYDFAQDIYGKWITVRLLAFKRPEQKFASLEALKQQMADDIAEGRYFHRGYR